MRYLLFLLVLTWATERVVSVCAPKTQSVQLCQLVCESVTSCTKFTWNKGTKECFLKDLKTPWQLSIDTNVISGTPNKPELDLDLDFNQGDIPDCTNLNGGKFIKKRNLLGREVERKFQ